MSFFLGNFMNNMLKISLFLLLATLLVPAVSALTAEPPENSQVRKGRRLYNQYCIPCHGREGDGRGDRAKTERLDPAPRDHTNGSYMNMLPDMRLFMVIKFGGRAMNLSQIMPQWGHLLSDEEIVSVIRYVRTLADPPWQPGMAMCRCRLPQGGSGTAGQQNDQKQ